MSDRYDPSRMTCPKCGIEQARAVDCNNCGVVVERYRAPPRYQLSSASRPVLTGGAIGAALLLLGGLALVGYGVTREVAVDTHETAVHTTATHPPDVTTPTRTTALDTYWGEGAAGFRVAVQTQIDLKVPMFVYFRPRECAECEQVQHELLNSPEFVAWVQDGLRVEINVDTDPANAALATRFAVSELPTLIAIRSDGTRIPIPLFVSGSKKTLDPKSFVVACKKATGR